MTATIHSVPPIESTTTPQRAMHSPPRKRATVVSVVAGGSDESPLRASVRVNESTEIETVRLHLHKKNATTVIFRDQMTGTAVEVTLDDVDMMRMLDLVGRVNEHKAAR